MPKPVIPALADLSQDIAGAIPIDLVRSWLESDRDAAALERLLAPFAVRGTIACSDSAGLSKLSVGKPLVEVMKLVSEPKECIFRHGRAIGGTAVGTWIADNTQMFYGDDVPVRTVVEHMAAAQAAMAGLAVKVGIGIHRGTAYEIGGGLYGADADEIEGFTEEETKGGEVAVSDAVLVAAGGLPIRETRGGKHVLDLGSLPSSRPAADDPYYPAPFPRAFHDAIRSLDAADAAAVEALHRAYAAEATVLLVRAFTPHQEFLLDMLADRVGAQAVMHAVAQEHQATMLEASGSLVIVRQDDAAAAARFAHDVISRLSEAGFPANVGACRGEILLFDRGDGTWNVAGAPVNVSSKLAEDTDERGVAFFESSVDVSGEPFSVVKSGVPITGHRA